MEVRDRILIVEDDKSIRNFLKAILEANHYDVILATTGEEAYSLITSRCPDLGADDYITKPFGTPELLARIRTAIRHYRAAGPSEGGWTGTFHAGGLTVDYDKHRAYVDGRDVNLTQNEFKLVALLAIYAGKVMTYDFLIRGRTWRTTIGSCG